MFTLNVLAQDYFAGPINRVKIRKFEDRLRTYRPGDLNQVGEWVREIWPVGEPIEAPAVWRRLIAAAASGTVEDVARLLAFTGAYTLPVKMFPLPPALPKLTLKVSARDVRFRPINHAPYTPILTAVGLYALGCHDVELPPPNKHVEPLPRIWRLPVRNEPAHVVTMLAMLGVPSPISGGHAPEYAYVSIKKDLLEIEQK